MFLILQRFFYKASFVSFQCFLSTWYKSFKMYYSLIMVYIHILFFPNIAILSSPTIIMSKPTSLSSTFDIVHPIEICLNGTNYDLWASTKIVFLKSLKLWCYVSTGKSSEDNPFSGLTSFVEKK